MPKHTRHYVPWPRLIHNILRQATGSLLLTVWYLRSNTFARGTGNVVCVLCARGYKTHRQIYRKAGDGHTHTYIMTRWLQSVEVGSWYSLFNILLLCLKYLTAAQVCYPSKESCLCNIYETRGKRSPRSVCHRIMLTPSTKTVKTLTNWTPAVLHIFVMDNSRLAQSVLSPPPRKKEGRSN